MAEFAAHLQSLRTQIPFSEMDPSMDLTSHFTFTDHDPSLNFHGMINFPSENFLSTQPQALDFPRNLAENLQGVFHVGEQSPLYLPVDTVKAELQECNSKKKRKAVDVSESSSGTVCSDVRSERINTSGRTRRRKGNDKEEEKPKEVVHVRAKRGQATDSHSLAERVRRGKINERLKCLQDIVPGCYKTMGMAVMLDEIINYVQSLQNQVEFLSMKLAAASSIYDFSSEANAMEAMETVKEFEAKDMERMRIGHGGQATNFSTASMTWHP